MKYWKTKDGKKLKITEMETSHIENCIKMLERNKSNILTELDMATEHGYYLTASIIAEVDEKWEDAIKSFKNELASRA